MADSQVKTNSRFQCKIYVHLDFLQNQTSTAQRKMWYGDSPLDPTRQINFCCTSNSISYCLPALPSDGCPVRGWGHCSRVTKKRHRQTSGCHSHSYDQIERHEVITHNRHRRAKLIWSICIILYNMSSFSSSVTRLAGCMPWKAQRFCKSWWPQNGSWNLRSP